MYKVGVDLGGTKIESVLLDDGLDVLKRKRIPTPQNNYLQILDSILSLILEMSEEEQDTSASIPSGYRNNATPLSLGTFG